MIYQVCWIVLKHVVIHKVTLIHKHTANSEGIHLDVPAKMKFGFCIQNIIPELKAACKYLPYLIKSLISIENKYSHT